ncbi:MAG: glycosyltransferase [Anaerolineae bacterium]
MRILIVTMSLPYPPTSGGAIRVHGITQGLLNAGHQVTLMTFHPGQHVPVPSQLQLELVNTAPPARSTIERLRDLALSSEPDIARRFYSPEFENHLRQLLKTQLFDVIQFEGIEAVCYLPAAKAAQPSARLVFDTFNAEYALQQGIFDIDRKNLRRIPAAVYSGLQVGRISKFEREMCRMADAVIAVSDEDADLLRDFREDRRVYVVPNGIWVENYSQTIDEDEDDEPTLVGQPMPVARDTLVFTGKMDYRPNVDAMLWFAEAVFPQVKQAVPNVYLYIVGQQPSPRLDYLKSMKGINITGRVESVLPYLQTASVYVAPLRMGSGTRLKLLEAMASSCPIVATSTASAGLNDEIKQAMMIADTPEQMAEAIITLLKTPERRQALRQNARHLVTQFYDWPVLIPRLLAAYDMLGV